MKTQTTLPGLADARVLRRIAFVVRCVPVAQPRQRNRIATAAGGGQYVQNYTPTDSPVNAFKAAVKLAASQAYRGPPLDGPLRFVGIFLMPRPKRLIWKNKPMPRCWAPTKGRNDWDNLGKGLADALTGQLWIDDGQIVWPIIRKLYASGSEQPGVLVEIRQVAEGEAA